MEHLRHCPEVRFPIRYEVMDRNKPLSVNPEKRTFTKALPSIILIMGVVMFSNLSRTILSPLLLEVEREFQLTHGPSSRLFLIVSIGSSFTLIASGYISSKITHRGTLLLCSAVLSLGLLLTAAAPNAAVLRFTMLLIGFGAGLYPGSGISVLNSLVIREHRQKALSVHELGPHTAMLAAPLVANFFLVYSSWRTAYLVLGIITLAVGFVFFFNIHSGYNRGVAPTLSLVGMLFKDPAFLAVMLFFGLALGAIQGIYALVPAFLVKEGGLGQEQANYLFSLSRAAPIASLMLAGMFQDRIGVRRALFFSVAGAGLLVCLMGILPVPLLYLAVLLQPAMGALVIPAAFGALTEIGPRGAQNVTISLMLPVAAVFGSGVVPAFIGYMGDAYSFSAGFIIFGLMVFFSSFLTRTAFKM